MSASDYVVEKTTLISGRGQGNLEEWLFRTGRIVHKSRVYIGNKQPVKTWEGLTRTEAKRKHNDRLVKTANGEKPAQRLLLSDVMVDAYEHLDSLAKRNEASRGTVKNYRAAWKKRIATQPIASMRLDQIDRAACLRFLRDLRKNVDLGTSTQNGTVSALRNVLHYARDLDYMSVDPFSGIPSREFPPQKDPNPRRLSRRLSNGESQQLLAAARSEAFVEQTDTLFTNAIILLRYQGPRSSEALGLHWREIHLIDEQISFVGQLARDQKVNDPVVIRPPKNGENGFRKPSMFPEVWSALNDQLLHEQGKGRGRPDDLVFTTATGQPMSRHSLLLAVRRAAALAGLGRVVPKDLRSSFFTAGVNAGISPAELSEMGGNTAAVVERFYAGPMRTAEQSKKNVTRFVASGF
jgi:site-specific recombinase XerD